MRWIPKMPLPLTSTGIIFSNFTGHVKLILRRQFLEKFACWVSRNSYDTSALICPYYFSFVSEIYNTVLTFYLRINIIYLQMLKRFNTRKINKNVICTNAYFNIMYSRRPSRTNFNLSNRKSASFTSLPRRKAYFYKLLIRAGRKNKTKQQQKQKRETCVILKHYLGNTNSHMNKRLKQVWLTSKSTFF